MRKLSPRQEHFVREYCANGHRPMKAAIAAGYPPKRANQAAYKLTHEVKQVMAEIAKRDANRNIKIEAEDFDALRELADQARAWRESKYGVNTAHVRAAELYVHLSGQSPEAKKIMAEIYGRMNASEFFGWTKEEIDTYVTTGQRPARLATASGSASVN